MPALCHPGISNEIRQRNTILYGFRKNTILYRKRVAVMSHIQKATQDRYGYRQEMNK
jgi:hypothetical protein